VDDIEAREDGGTPGFLQAIKTALCIKLKEEMGVANIQKREEHLLNYLWDELSQIPNLVILASNHKHRLGIISFCIDDLHFNLGVRLLNDRFGIQVRGGCSCAGTYGHYLLNLDEVKSRKMSHDVDSGYLYTRPGWIRLSIHPTTTDKEAEKIVRAIKKVAKNHQKWAADYEYNPQSNEFHHKDQVLEGMIEETVEDWFETTLV
jgi:selenocysteine lyase/cysteine desulfurase